MARSNAIFVRLCKDTLGVSCGVKFRTRNHAAFRCPACREKMKARERKLRKRKVAARNMASEAALQEAALRESAEVHRRKRLTFDLLRGRYLEGMS